MSGMENKQLAEEIALALSGGAGSLTVSGPFKANAEYKKIVAQPVTLKGGSGLQFSFYTENKVFHSNCTSQGEIVGKLVEIFDIGYKQWDIQSETMPFKLLVNKKGSVKKLSGKASNLLKKNEPTHNRQKNYIFKEGEPLDMLVSLGLMNKEGKILADKQKKFRQINKFVEIASTVAEYVEEGAQILDFGCGKSYLTFALYYYFNHILNKNVKITGLDLKADVVDYCNKLAEECGFENLKFFCGDVSKFEDIANCRMMVTLHACDTATDYALGYAINNNVKVILSVPCCQHELFYQVENEMLEPMLKHGILKERFASLITDTARGQLLEVYGYRVNIMEFVDMEHTAKNIMIKAVKTRDVFDSKKLEQYNNMAAGFNIRPTLYNLTSGKGE